MIPPLEFEGLENAAVPEKPLHLAIGIFDGVHRGHRVVIQAAVDAARAHGGLSGVLTFWPHPSVMFHPENPTRLMLDRATKARVIAGLGVDVIITQPFTPQFAAVPAEEFLPELKRRLPGLATLHVGDNFRFGQGRQGDVAMLRALAPTLGVQVFSVPPITVAGAIISSTRVRAQLEAGDIEAVNELLGYSYFASGRVTPGKQLGRTIGFPTLNLAWSPELKPRFGVYVVKVSGPKAPAALPGVANYGLRPTVEDSVEPRLEVHLLGLSPFDAGDTVTVEWLRFLRPEAKFANVDELRAQIGRDRDAARDFLRSA